MNPKKKVSIITITYNNLKGLKRTVESVLCQSAYEDIEYIVIDGDSSDGTKDYLRTLPQEILWISEKDRGISHAFNKGVQRTTGEAVLCLNSGDSLVNSTVIKKVAEDWEKEKVDILSYKAHVQGEVYLPYTDDEEIIWNECEEPHQATFVSKRVYEQIGGFSEEYKIRMDYHFFARCRAHEYRFKFIPETIAEYEPGGTSMAAGNRARFWREGLAVKMLYDLKIEKKDYVKMLVYRQ